MSSTQVAIYARVSSDQQAEAQTVASQVAALRERVAAEGLALPDAMQFIDEGYSGATLIRPALERLRDVIAARAVDRLYIHSPDRLARKYAYQVLLVDEFRRAGVEVIFLNRALGQSPEDDLLLQVQGMIAEYERAKIIERHRRGKRHAAQAGVVNVLSGAPYGYRYVAKYAGGGHARYEIVPDEARLVRQVFDWVGRDRQTIGEVCRRLTRAGEVTRTGKTVWDRSMVWGMLKNPAYIGTAAFGKTRQEPLRPRLRAQRGRALQPRRAVSTVDVPPEDWFCHPGPCACRPRGVCRGPGTIAGESPPCAAIPARRALFAPRLGPVSALWLCLLWETPQPQCPQREAAGVRVLPLPWDGCVPLWRRTDLSEYPSADRSARCGGVARGLNAARPPGAPRRGIPASVATRIVHHSTLRVATVETHLGKLRQGLARLIDSYADGLIDKQEFEPRILRLRRRIAQAEEQRQQLVDADTLQTELQLIIGRLEDFAAQVHTA